MASKPLPRPISTPSADQLTLAQASFLAGLPQSPAVHDIYTNREATLIRHRSVLVLMYTLSQERGCITVSNSPSRFVSVYQTP